MKKFKCPKCANRIYFENVQCLRCGHALGFEPETLEIAALEPVEPGLYKRFGAQADRPVRYCANAEHGVCNWIVPFDDRNGFCRACELNRTIPNLSEPGSLVAWSDLERAKKRLVYSLLRFGLPVDGGGTGKGPLTFDFARNAMTGHLDGVVTIDVMEADAVERERQRQQFDERYRSLLGHLRHESGHYYWMLLIEAGERVEDFRAVFGDERDDYQAALHRHHTQGCRLDWQFHHVSAYASCHPWEDWAETWAHYIHMVDAIDTAEAQGIEPRAAGLVFGSTWPFKTYDIYREETFEALMERWIPLTLALNNLNRSMGHNDFYPFVLSTPAVAKLAFVHKMVRDHVRAPALV